MSEAQQGTYSKAPVPPSAGQSWDMGASTQLTFCRAGCISTAGGGRTKAHNQKHPVRSSGT